MKLGKVLPLFEMTIFFCKSATLAVMSKPYDLRTKQICAKLLFLSGMPSFVWNGSPTSMKLGKVLPLFEMTTFSVNQHRLSKFVQSIFSFQECLVAIGTDLPPLFATWTFYEHDMQYTPITKGSEAVFDCSAYYKIKLDDAFMDYLAGSSFQVHISDFSNWYLSLERIPL